MAYPCTIHLDLENVFLTSEGKNLCRNLWTGISAWMQYSQHVCLCFTK